MNLPVHCTTSPDPSVASLLKQHTKQQKTAAFPPGSAHTSPGEIAPDRLAVSTHRQAPDSSQSHCFLVIAWWSTPCRQAPKNTGTPDAIPIVWRTYSCRQVLYQ